MTLTIGLCGYAQSGKDTLGQLMVERAGFTHVAFADTLRAAMSALNPHVQWGTNFVPWNEVVGTIGYERAKKETNGRELLQRLGTEVGRNLIHDDVWVEAAFKQINAFDDYVFTDVRFPNEANKILDEGGEIYRVVRPGTAPVNAIIANETVLNGMARAMKETFSMPGCELVKTPVGSIRR